MSRIGCIRAILAPADRRAAGLGEDHAALGDSGATAYVGGRAARYGDDKLAGRIPVFAAAVVGLSLPLLLIAAFRSWRAALLSAVSRVLEAWNRHPSRRAAEARPQRARCGRR